MMNGSRRFWILSNRRLWEAVWGWWWPGRHPSLLLCSVSSGHHSGVRYETFHPVHSQFYTLYLGPCSDFISVMLNIKVFQNHIFYVPDFLLLKWLYTQKKDVLFIHPHAILHSKDFLCPCSHDCMYWSGVTVAHRLLFFNLLSRFSRHMGRQNAPLPVLSPCLVTGPLVGSCDR